MPSQSKPIPELTPYGAALAGALGGCFSTAVVYPLDVAKTRIQAFPNDGKGKNNRSMMSMLLRIYRKEGVFGLYRGFGATMLNTFSMQYAYFFFYSFVRTTYISRLRRRLPAGAMLPPLSTAAELLLGAVAGALAQIFTIPVSVIATRQQVGRPNQSTPPDLPGRLPSPEDDTFLAVAREIIAEEGITGLWLGLKPGLVLTVNPAITYGLFERVKGLILHAQAQAGAGSRLSPWMSFFIGTVSKTLATVVTYPYIMAKVRIQARSGIAENPTGDGKFPLGLHGRATQVGALNILAGVWRTEGLTGWYQGMQAQIIKAVLSQALLFMSKEQFEHWALEIMIITARITTRSKRYS